MNNLVDLRSDTVTRPSAAMRRAMADAEVGDDWYGDDPTVNRLQDLAAEVTGREAGAYLPTGSMCNQIAMHALVRPGHFVVAEATSHVAGAEAASSATLSGIAFRQVRAKRGGLLKPSLVADALVPDPYKVEAIDLVAIENTHQVGGGSVMPIDDARAIAEVCAADGVPVYLDGARIFNASVVTGTTVADYASTASAMMFCLSKGLGAPIGSILVGDEDFIREARRLKIVFGGAWRQAGIMAAAGLIALRDGPKRLAQDHENARRLAEGLGEILPGSIDPTAVQTNIVFADVTGTGLSVPEWAIRLAEEGLLVSMVDGRIRMLTHLDVTAADINTALDAWHRVTKQLKPVSHAGNTMAR